MRNKFKKQRYFLEFGIDDSFWGVLFKVALPFFLGALLSQMLTIFQDMIVLYNGSNQLGNRIAFWIIAGLTAFSLVGVALAYIVWQMVQDTRNRSRFSIFLDRDFHRAGRTHQRAFNRCLSEALNAGKSIYVLSPHFPVVESNAPAEEKIDDSNGAHANYLESGMEEVIERHVRDNSSDFVYKRIVQVEPGVTKNIPDSGEAHSSLFNDDAMARHVQKMISENENAHSVDLRVHARSFVPSFPSTLIIDDRFVFFSLPTYTSADNKEGARTLDFDMVLGLEDTEGELPRVFRQILTQFEIAGREIKGVTESPRS